MTILSVLFSGIIIQIQGEFSILEQYLSKQIINNGTYNQCQSIKIRDNKLVDYLKSGQKKFPYNSDKVLNIVMVSVRSADLQDYWQYLYNGYSGLFTDNSFIDKDEYSKVDLVLLTNALEGHYNPSEKYNSWHIENYCNLLCWNPRNIRNGNLSDKHKAFMENFPNSQQQFDQYYVDFLKTIKHEPASNLELLLFPHYMDKYHSLQWNN